MLESNITEIIHNKIIDFSRKFNEIGDAFYNISSSTILKVERYKELDNEHDSEINILNIPDKNIIIKYYSNYMLRYHKATTLQVILYDSPLISIKSNGKKDKSSDVVNTFINIMLYNDKNEVIKINKIEEKYKPEILYLKSKYNFLEKCFYYKEEKKDLKTDGIIIDENYEINGQKYIRCTSNHLTAFTAGTYNFNSNLPWWAVLLIVGSILTLLVGFVIIFVIIKKRNKYKGSVGHFKKKLSKMKRGLLY